MGKNKHEKKNEKKSEENKKKNKKNKIYMLALFIVFTVGSVVGYIQYEYRLELRQKEQNIQAEIDKQKEVENELNKQGQYYDSDEYVEKIARDKLGLVKPNEILFVDKNK